MTRLLDLPHDGVWLHVHGKGARNRLVPVPRSALAATERYFAARGLVFGAYRGCSIGADRAGSDGIRRAGDFGKGPGPVWHGFGYRWKSRNRALILPILREAIAPAGIMR